MRSSNRGSFIGDNQIFRALSSWPAYSPWLLLDVANRDSKRFVGGQWEESARYYIGMANPSCIVGNV